MTSPAGPLWQAGGPENGALTGINRRSGLSTLPSSIFIYPEDEDRDGLQNVGL